MQIPRFLRILLLHSMLLRLDHVGRVRAFSVALSKRRSVIQTTSRLFSVVHDDDAASKAPLSRFKPLASSAYQIAPCPMSNIPLLPNQRLICIGDVHGDIHALKAFLQVAQVYDEQEGWIGTNSIVVQCGDVLDRGPDELECWQLLVRLSHQAQAHGGHIICLWGNHEALNAGGLFKYTTGDAEYETHVGKTLDQQLLTNRWRLQFAGNQPARWACYEPGGLLSEPLLQHLKVAVKVGKTLCVHAGLTKQQLQEWGGLEGMNQMAAEWIKTVHHGDNNNAGSYETVAQASEEAQNRAKKAAMTIPPCLGGVIGSTSPIWMRDYSYPPDVVPKSEALEKLNDLLQYCHADRLVVGHTVQWQINCVAGKAWRIDVGASRWVAQGTPQVLEIVMQPDGTEQVSIMTKYADRIPEHERHITRVAEVADFFGDH